MSKPDSIMIDDVKYVRADAVSQMAAQVQGMDYVICRTYSAGVFAGYLAKREGREVTMKDARRIWYWAGAASLSQMAIDGTSQPDNCKFPAPVPEVLLLEAIEIIPVTAKAEASIKAVPVWKQ